MLGYMQTKLYLMDTQTSGGCHHC